MATKRIANRSKATVYHLQDESGRVIKTFRLTKEKPVTVFRLEIQSETVRRSKLEQLEREALSYFGMLLNSLEEILDIDAERAASLAESMHFDLDAADE